jgi:hypothetical protein
VLAGLGEPQRAGVELLYRSDTLTILNVVFDTGMHPDCRRDPAGRIGPRVTELFSFGGRGRRRPPNRAKNLAG